MLYRYFSIILAAALLIAGLQVPGFIDQYEHRLNAHLVEVTHNLRGFQNIADEHHNGSIAALIDKHRRSNDETFRSEGDVIEDMNERFLRFSAEYDALQTSLGGRIWLVALEPDPEIFSETAANYTYNIPLNTDSAICGGALLVFGILLSDLLRMALRRLFSRPKATNSAR